MVVLRMKSDKERRVLKKRSVSLGPKTLMPIS